ncbi:TRAUB domain protein [Ostertagia ostertagi]
MSMKSLSKRICESEEQFAKFRDSTLVKWEGRTRLIASRRPKNASTDFSAFEKENIVSQIEKVCSDKQRLVKRSRVKKSDIERIGGNPEAEEDEEIYDDDDFYQVLLKELISKKSNNTQDPVAMTRHYIEMQKLKSKRARRKEIDNRASKDRKIKISSYP